MIITIIIYHPDAYENGLYIHTAYLQYGKYDRCQGTVIGGFRNLKHIHTPHAQLL